MLFPGHPVPRHPGVLSGAAVATWLCRFGADPRRAPARIWVPPTASAVPSAPVMHVGFGWSEVKAALTGPGCSLTWKRFSPGFTCPFRSIRLGAGQGRFLAPPALSTTWPLGKRWPRAAWAGGSSVFRRAPCASGANNATELAASGARRPESEQHLSRALCVDESVAVCVPETVPTQCEGRRGDHGAERAGAAERSGRCTRHARNNGTNR